MTLLARLGAVLVVVLGTTSCTGSEPDGKPSGAEQAEGDAPVVQLGAPGEGNRTLSPEDVEELSTPMHTEADVEFVEMMIPHHEQALEMAALVPDRAGDPGLLAMVERMEVSQADEIQQLKDWLTTNASSDSAQGDHGDHGSDHGSDHGGDHGDQHADMPGMLTPQQLDRMRDLDGRAFDRYFLRAMINHHDGAIMMVQDLMDGGEGGQETTIFQLANHIGSDQAVEIAAMKRRLKALGG
ncbi:Uncharacterized conserved protein, DUF305 family [Nocardioides exalbidus]|uniref:Uncharacterized conserved protein, DUF305 family n=1 Tax=Nocardioides exalbidus TaxID=402596 RepID=A0A1H4I3A5_9ACTN|nr:DUF305 domain-containing protein [Nocardioides exalbidus]SEB28564.1 Uncharacterized conserved protein, DUF305 family [Nocardioides exalbidus]